MATLPAKSNVSQATWSQDKTMIATNPFDGVISVWDANAYCELTKLNYHAEAFAFFATWHSNKRDIVVPTVGPLVELHLWKMPYHKKLLGQKIAGKKFSKIVLPKWYTSIISQIPQNLKKPQRSIFDLHHLIPGRFIEYAIKKSPQEVTEKLFAGKINDTLEFVAK